MTGLELLIEKLNEKGFSFGPVNISQDDSNGNFELINSNGESTIQNYKRISEIYGSLTFFHFSPEQAIEQIIEMIDMQINIKS